MIEAVAVVFLLLGFLLSLLGGWRVLHEVVDSPLLRLVGLVFPMIGVILVLLNFDQAKELKLPLWLLLAGCGLIVVAVILMALVGSSPG